MPLSALCVVRGTAADGLDPAEARLCPKAAEMSKEGKGSGEEAGDKGSKLIGEDSRSEWVCLVKPGLCVRVAAIVSVNGRTGEDNTVSRGDDDVGYVKVME